MIKEIKIRKMICTVCNYVKTLKAYEKLPDKCPVCFDNEYQEWQHLYNTDNEANEIK